MSDEGWCRYGGRKLANENCEQPAEDGLPAQSVGAWARLKHERLSAYLAATHAVRAKFIEPKGRGGAAFIDLFSGPGRVRVRDCKDTEPGSALIAFEHQAAPFSRLIFCDLEPDNVHALRTRTAGDPRVRVIEGDCNERIDEVLKQVPAEGLNLAFFDPFGAKVFHWDTIARLAHVKRMDLLIHFPTNAIKRNFDNPSVPKFKETIDRMFGNENWRSQVQDARDVAGLIDVLREQLAGLGYDGEMVNTLPVANDHGGLLYHLVFASKAPRGTAIWKSLSRHHGAQRGLGL